LVFSGLNSGTVIIKEWLVTGEVKTEEIQAHETSTSMVKAGPAQLDAGTDIALKVKVSCSSACDLRGKIVKIITQDAAVKEIELVTFDGTVNETDEFVVKAPTQPGGYTWTAVFPAQEKEGILHKESSAPFSFIVKSHTTSIAVWDVPSPVAFGNEFKLKVGVRCSAECKLTGKDIEIYDHEGAKVATGTLGDVPWSGATALYWAEVELKAPSPEGYYTWEVKFPKPDLELPHEGASYNFGFGAARQPEHVVTVEVIDKDVKTPIKNAHILLHPHRGYVYRSRTDERGVARVNVPKGEYELCATKDEYETFQTTVEVAGDIAIKAELMVREREWWEG
jgi:hypothetical protein